MQLEDGHSLFDYDVGLNDTVQLMVRPVATLPAAADTGASAAQNGNETHRRDNGTDSASDDNIMESVSKCSQYRKEQRYKVCTKFRVFGASQMRRFSIL